jgi:putative IMPACT (imprinted ancient) family translation regulator
MVHSHAHAGPQAHVAAVHSREDVAVVLETLLQDRRVARATHNIMAYRVVQRGVVMQDNDDDGETAAGGRLAHLLDILAVENVVVVVSRWYGGIQLGPDRFKHINNVARQALETFGFLPT